MDTPLELRVSQRGFGMIEIVISMLLLGLLAIAFLPLLITSMKSSVTNSSVATATQLADRQTDLARTEANTCTLLKEFRDKSLSVISDARGVSYQPAREVLGPCPTSYPGTMMVKVSVSIVGSTIAPITVTTLIYLKAN